MSFCLFVFVSFLSLLSLDGLVVADGNVSLCLIPVSVSFLSLLFLDGLVFLDSDVAGLIFTLLVLLLEKNPFT